MFVRDFVHLPRPFAGVSARFVSDTSWIEALARGAIEAAVELAGVRAPEPVPSAAPAHVRLELGPLRFRGEAIVLGLHWETDCPPPVFTSLDGDLEIAALGDRATQVTVEASYELRQPAAPFGAADPAEARVAEAALRALLRSAASEVEVGSRISGSRGPGGRP